MARGVSPQNIRDLGGETRADTRAHEVLSPPKMRLLDCWNLAANSNSPKAVWPPEMTLAHTLNRHTRTRNKDLPKVSGVRAA